MDDAVVLETGLGPIKVLQQHYPHCTVARCLGIPFARISQRWASPRPTSGLEQEPNYLPGPSSRIYSCTSYGPGCPQSKAPLFDINSIPLFGRENENGNSISIRPKKEDEFECLNLNIFLPFSTCGTLSSKLLPVIVWVHGGAYVVGAGSVDLYDGSEQVARSVAIANPVIVVTINYRLGILGFLHSRELAGDAGQQTDIPPVFRGTGNLGILDCYRAFEWVKKNIQSFGGDPNNITGMGESAGAAILSHLSVIPHLHTKISRTILCSSTIFSNQIMRAGEAQKWFDMICERNGIMPGAEGCVEQLRLVPIQELVTKSAFAESSFRPTWDDVTITEDPRKVIDDASLWDTALEGIIFGHCENECWLRLLCASGHSPNLRRSISGRVPPAGTLREVAERLYMRKSGFEWFAPNKRTNQFSPQEVAWMAFDSHARYYVASQLISDSFLRSKRLSSGAKQPSTIYKYVMSWKTAHWPPEALVTHTADILPLFLHPSLSLAERRVAETFTDNVIIFAQPKRAELTWSLYTSHSRCLNVLSSSGKWEVMREGEGEFGITPDIVDFWRRAISDTLAAGRDGWDGIIR